MIRRRLCIFGKNIMKGMLSSSQCIIDHKVNFLVWEILKQTWMISISSEKENQDAYRDIGVVCTNNDD